MQWLAAFTACPALAQEAISGEKAASSDPDPIEHEIAAPGISIGLTKYGHIIGLKLGENKLEVPFHACTVLAECRPLVETKTRALPDGGLQVQRTYVQSLTRNECIVTERFVPTRSSIRWQLEIVGIGVPWTTLIQTQLAWLNASNATFWTAWDHNTAGVQWSDPLVQVPFSDLKLRYGGLLGANDAFSVSIATIFEEQAAVALSLVQSPEDVLLDMQLNTTVAGDVILSRINHRISPSNPIRFSMDLVAHPADWRAGLGWMVDRYSNYFNPPNPAVYSLDGCGTYTGYQGELDNEKLRKMAFSVNWNAHFDFPYEGMYAPPVSANETWNSWYNRPASYEQMSNYSTQMKKSGFHVLEYFNLLEAGNYIQEDIQGRIPPRKAKSDDDLWRDPNDFVNYQIPDAVVRDRAGKLFTSWFNSVFVDPADPVWQHILVAMAQRLVKYLPNSDGICLDVLSWLSKYNVNRDDGVSWIDGRPARSLIVSWKEAMPKIAAIFHEAGKFIYANPLVRRIDINRYVDGFYDESGDYPEMINLTAMLSVRKPAIAWVHDINVLRPDPDAMFQRHLYLGVFPTVPVQGADHTIVPDAWSDRYFLDYGPLLAAIRGKKWVLEPHAISVENRAALANIFEVPGGYAIPVTFAKNVDEVTVALRNIPRSKERIISVRVLHPGEDQATDLHAEVAGNDLKLRVPVKRGCAVVTIECAHAPN